MSTYPTPFNFPFKTNTIVVVFVFFLPCYSEANELDKTSACAGVVMGDGSVRLGDLNDEKSFNGAFKLVMNAYYG